MSIETKHMEEFDNFLRGNMSKTEESDFLKRIGSDPQLQEELNSYQDIQAVLQNKANLKTKAFLQSKESKIVSIDRKPAPIFRWISMAASLLILAGIISFMFGSENNGLDNLYAEYYSPYPNEYVKIERGDTQSTEAHQIFIDYSSGSYDKVVTAIDSYNKKHDDPKLDFYKAIALMGLDKHESSLKILKDLKNADIEDFGNQIDWYIALNGLKLDKVKLSKEHLENILASNNTFRKTSAKKLLDTL